MKGERRRSKTTVSVREIWQELGADDRAKGDAHQMEAPKPEPDRRCGPGDCRYGERPDVYVPPALLGAGPKSKEDHAPGPVPPAAHTSTSLMATSLSSTPMMLSRLTGTNIGTLRYHLTLLRTPARSSSHMLGGMYATMRTAAGTTRAR